MPGQLKRADTNEPASLFLERNKEYKEEDVEEDGDGYSPKRPPRPQNPLLKRLMAMGSGQPTLGEEETESEESEEEVVPAKEPPNPKDKYVWRIDLSQSEPHWEGWFKGLSKK